MTEQLASKPIITNKSPSLLTKREFMKQASITVLAAFLAPYMRKPKHSSLPTLTPNEIITSPEGQIVTKSRAITPKRQLEEKNPIKVNDKNSLTDTAVKSALLFLADFVSTPILKALKIPVGNAGVDPKLIKELMEKPFNKTLLLGGVVDPLVEEIIFRALPNMLIAGHQKKDVWEIGIPTSALFALAHNFTVNEDTNKYIFSTNKIPLEQFVFGLFLWKMMRERGFPHAVIGHATINSAGLIVAKTLYEVFPDLKKSLK